MVTFILWNMFSATVLCFAIPQVYTELSEMKFHFIILSLIGVVSAFLWNIRRKEKVNFKRMQLRKKLNE